MRERTRGDGKGNQEEQSRGEAEGGTKGATQVQTGVRLAEPCAWSPQPILPFCIFLLNVFLTIPCERVLQGPRETRVGIRGFGVPYCSERGPSTATGVSGGSFTSSHGVGMVSPKLATGGDWCGVNGWLHAAGAGPVSLPLCLAGGKGTPPNQGCVGWCLCIHQQNSSRTRW